MIFENVMSPHKLLKFVHDNWNTYGDNLWYILPFVKIDEFVFLLLRSGNNQLNRAMICISFLDPRKEIMNERHTLLVAIIDSKNEL